MASGGHAPLVEFSALSQLTVDDPALRMRLVGQCWRDNLQAGVTGVLRLREDRLEQVIEGPGDVILRLATGILTDRRHGWIMIRAFGPIAARRYPDWSFEGLDLNQVLLKEGPASSANLHVLPGQAEAAECGAEQRPASALLP